MNAADRNRVAAGFVFARVNKKTIGVGYTLEQKEFVAKITALKTGNDAYNYFVKVQELKK